MQCLSVILVFCCAFGGVVSLIALNCNQLACKLKWQERAAAHGLTTRTVALGSYDAGEKEVMLDGCLYDVASYTVTGDSITLTLFHDAEEQQVQQEMAAQSQPQDDGNTSRFSEHKYHIPDYKITPSTPFDPVCCTLVQALRQYGYRYPVLLSSKYAGIFKPPPEQSC